MPKHLSCPNKIFAQLRSQSQATSTCTYVNQYTQVKDASLVGKITPDDEILAINGVPIAHQKVFFPGVLCVA